MKIIDTFYGAYYDERERPLGSIDFGISEKISSFTLYFSFPVSQINLNSSDT
jgi:hypothetical protein